MNFFNQHSICMYDGYMRRLSREISIKKRLSFGAFVSQGYYCKWHSIEDIVVWTCCSIMKIIPVNIYTIFPKVCRERRRIAYHRLHTYWMLIKKILLRIRTGENILWGYTCGSNHVFTKCSVFRGPPSTSAYFLLPNVQALQRYL
jgi:hypothetical protein